MPSLRLDGRATHELRPLHFTRSWIPTLPGSVLVDSGLTRVLCTAVVEEGVPKFLKGTDQGWVTAEYSMLPAATNSRRPRDRNGRIDGRSVEIQRLIGRALRAIVDRRKLKGRTVWVDCDVLAADGGTRTAAINGAYVALHDALRDLQQRDGLKSWPLVDSVQAISVGLVEGEPHVDLSRNCRNAGRAFELMRWQRASLERRAGVARRLAADHGFRDLAREIEG